MSFRNNLIFSRNQDNSALSIDTIKQLAPAVYGDSKAMHLTDRYVSLHTSDLIPVMQDYGYVPVQAAQRKSRKLKISEEFLKDFENTPENIQKALALQESHNAHLISFAHVDNLHTSEQRPEIILYNSHDGSSSVQLYAGCYRFICSNGIVAGEGFSNRMYHSKTGMQGFETILRSTVESLPLMQERIMALKQVELGYAHQVELARNSLKSRWELLDERRDAETAGTFADQSTINAALRVTRMGDSGSDAFTVFNRIQETVVRGKAYVQSFTKANLSGMTRKARPVSSAKESIRINTELWDAVELAAFN